MKKAILFSVLVLSFLSLSAQRQIVKEINVARSQTKPQRVAALNLATALFPLENTLAAQNTAVQFTTNRAILAQMEAEKPSFLEFTLPVTADSTVVLELMPNAIFGDKFKVTNARDEEINVSKGVFYKGIIKGDANSVVSLALSNGELSGIVSNERGNYVLGKIKQSLNYIFYNDHELLAKSAFKCGVADAVRHTVEAAHPANAADGIESAACRAIQIYVEADNAIYAAQSANLTNVTTFVNALFGQVAVLYNNEGILIQMSQLKIWDTADPYVSATNSRGALDLFTTRIGSDFTGDLAHLLSARDLGGGIAYVDRLCIKELGQSTGFSGGLSTTVVNVPTYSWNVEVVTHELGHNFGSLHTQSCTWAGGPIDNCVAVEDGTCSPGPTPTNGGTIMSYCHITSAGINFNKGFGPLPGNLIRTKTATCIGSLLSLSTPSVTNVRCRAGSDGQIVVSATGETGTISYAISPNVGSQSPVGTFTGLTAQTYSVFAKTASGCVATALVTITQPATTLSLSTPSVISPSNPTATDGSITVTASGSTPPYTYRRSGSNTTNQTGVFTGLSVGTYTITVTDNCGFTATSTADLFYRLNLTTNNTAICNSSAVNLNNFITTNGSTVVWSEKPQATAIAAGYNHNLAVLSDGSVMAWGQNGNGQTTVPNTVVNAKEVAGGGGHSIALLSNGSVVGWGSNNSGQVTVPNTAVGVKVLSAGNFYSLALLNNGSVVGWGSNSNNLVSSANAIVNATAISAGDFFAIALLNNGSVVGWGSNESGQTSVPNTVVNPKAIAAGGYHGLALLNNGSVIGWGWNNSGQINIPSAAVGVKAIAGGGEHSLALLSNGSVVGWGKNSQGQVTIPSTVVGATAISAGAYHSLALLGNGSVISWGSNSSGQGTDYDALPLSNATVSPTTTKTYYVVVSDGNDNKMTDSVTVTVGTVTLPPTTTNNALSFDGSSDCVEIANCANTPLSISDALTIEYWFKGSNLQSAVRLQPSGSVYIVAGWNGKHIISTDGGTTNGISVGAAATDGNWHHVAMTWQKGAANGFKSYLDGNLVEQRNAANLALPSIASGIYLGAYNGSSEFMNGTLDEVRVWNVVRTQTEIQNNRLGCNNLSGSTGLVLYYQFNHGAASGNNNSISTLSNSANSATYSAILRNFARTGSTSNWVASPLCTTILPVELLGFKGTPQYNGNFLTWTTANEVNNKGFYVERAPQPPQGALLTWEILDFVAPKSPKGTFHDYEFTDKSPLWGLGAYRLRQMDNDGKETLSKVITIQNSPFGGKGALSVYPNPAHNSLTIDCVVDTQKETSYTVVNTLGQVLLQGQWQGKSLDISTLPRGAFILKIGEGQAKFFKQ